jgi:hypothetical protein
MAWLRSAPASANDVRSRTAVLLVNVGTPQAPTVRAVRQFLARFLRDRRVVDLPALLWWPLLYGFVLPLRPRRSVCGYRKIWTAQGSPLAQFTAGLARKLQAKFDETAPDRMRVAYAMCYSAPGVAQAAGTGGKWLRAPAGVAPVPATEFEHDRRGVRSGRQRAVPRAPHSRGQLRQSLLRPSELYSGAREQRSHALGDGRCAHAIAFLLSWNYGPRGYAGRPVLRSLS